MSETTIKAEAFHPMRGHVADGVKVAFPNGSILTVKATMRGWTLMGGDGLQHAGPTHDANELTACIVKIDAGCETLVA